MLTEETPPPISDEQKLNQPLLRTLTTRLNDESDERFQAENDVERDLDQLIALKNRDELECSYYAINVSSLLPWGGLLLPTGTRRTSSMIFGSSFLSSGGILLLLWSESILGGLLKLRLPTDSLKDSSSPKDNLIETRTKIIVGAMPYAGKCHQ